MKYTLYDDFIPLQALLKEVRIIQSGGAAKAFLASNPVLFNGELETRRGKKLRIGDSISLPQQDLTITLVAPTEKEQQQYEADQAEKKRVAALVKQLNQENRQQTTVAKKPRRSQKTSPKTTKTSQTNGRKPVRFPGT